MQAVDFVLLLNAVLSSIVFASFVYKGRLFYRYYRTHQKWIYATLGAYSFTAMYGSFEAYAQNVDFGIRYVLLLIANVIALIAFVAFPNSAFTDKTYR